MNDTDRISRSLSGAGSCLAAAFLLGVMSGAGGPPVVHAADEPAAPAVGAVEKQADEDGFVPLFAEDGAPDPALWTTGLWSDVSLPAPEGAVWEIRDGVLLGGKARGSWLMSRKEYGDFVLEFEFKLGPRGNGGCALRAPMKGDPAFDGMEIQMADLRYNPEAKPSELTGGIYRAIAPKEQVYRPEEWNRYRIELVGSRLKAELNGTLIHDLDLEDYAGNVARHDGTPAPAPRDRPRRGHIGFQELSQDGDRVMVRNARIRDLEPTSSDAAAQDSGAAPAADEGADPP